MTENDLLAAFLERQPSDAGWAVTASKTVGDQAVAVLETRQYGAPISQTVAFEFMGGQWVSTASGGALGGGSGKWYAAIPVPTDVDAVIVETGLVQHRLVPVDNWALGVGRCGAEGGLRVVAHAVAGKYRDGWPMPDVRSHAPPPNLDVLAQVHDAQTWVWGALHQVERFLAALRDHRPGPYGLPPTPEQRREQALLDVEGDLMLIAAAQARKALQPLQPELRFTSELNSQIRLLRNIHEHYEQTRLELGDPDVPMNRSAPQFNSRYPGEPAWAIAYGSDGHKLSVISIETLWRELADFEVELARRRDAVLNGTSEPFVPGSMVAPRPFPVIEPTDTTGTVIAFTQVSNAQWSTGEHTSGDDPAEGSADAGLSASP